MNMYTVRVQHGSAGWDAPDSAQTLEQLLALLSEPGMSVTIERTD